MSIEQTSSPNLARFALGGRAPRAAVTPSDLDELLAAVNAAHRRGESAVLFGGGTLQGMGNLPARYDVAISLRALNKRIAYEPRDLTIAIQAGMTRATLADTLARHRQFVPFDAPRPLHGTVGGVLASGWSGPRRAAYGRPRDFLIGASALLADGTIAETGGMTVKNVTGYDLGKLYIGSLGTLGALIRVNLRTLPLPAARRAAIATLPKYTRERVLRHLEPLAVEPTAALLIDGFTEEIEGRDGVDGRLMLWFEGSIPAVDRGTRELRSQLGAAGVPETRLIDRNPEELLQRAIDAYVTPLEGRSIIYRSTGEPTTLQERIALVTQSAHEAAMLLETIADLRTGDLIARASTETEGELESAAFPLEEAIHRHLGRVTLLAAPERLRANLDAWGTPPSGLAYLRELKTRFDPTGTFAPGRLVGGI